MTNLAQLIISGIAQGSVYALVALGFALIFGVSNILNIAHGETIMLCPALALLFIQSADINPWIAFPAAFVATVLASLLMHLVAVQPFLDHRRRHTILAPLIASFGVTIIVDALMGQEIGTGSNAFPVHIPTTLLHIPGGIWIAPSDLVCIFVSVVVMIGISLVVSRTDFGRSMRAVAENRLVAQTLGISITRTIIIATAIAGALGAVAGLLFSGGSNSVTSNMGLIYGLVGLVALIIGGVSRPAGAVLAAFGIGIAQSLTTGYISSGYTTPVTFGLLIVFLVFRPHGLLVSAAREGRP